MTPQDAPAGPVLGERTKIVDALAELVFVGRDGTYADWQQRPLREQTERVTTLLSSAREEGAAAERERVAELLNTRSCQEEIAAPATALILASVADDLRRPS